MDTAIDPEEMKNLAISLGHPYAQQNELGDQISSGPHNELGYALPAPSGPDLSVSPPQRGTLEGDKAERARQLKTGAGVDQIYGKVTNSSFGQNHPLLGKILGGLGQGIAKVGDIGLSAVAPALAINLPGTEYHHQAGLNHLNRQIGSEEKENTEESQQQNMAAELPLHQAQTAEANANTAHLQAQTDQIGEPAPKEEHWSVLPEYSGPNGEPVEIEQNSGQLRSTSAGGAKLNKTPKESNPQQQTYDALIKSGLTPVQAYEKIREKPGGTVINQGTWALDEDANGKPVLFNSKTGETKEAPGIQKIGTKSKADAAEEKRVGPSRDALAYAKDYRDKGVFTGPGDEALMEKFFELAKPSSGFRMSQQQIDMLKNARSWMNGLEGHLRHATSGTWFSDDQRKEIVDTMENLDNAKQKPSAGGSAPVEGTVKTNSAGDKIAFKNGKWGPA